MNPLFVGQAPSKTMAPDDPPFWNTQALTRLAKYARVHPRERLYDMVAFDNVIEQYPGRQESGKYDQFPKELWEPGKKRIHERVRRERREMVVLLGRQTATAMDIPAEWPYFRWTWRRVVTDHEIPGLQGWDFMLAVCPHPGGTNMWWNDASNEANGRQFLEAAVRGKMLRQVETLCVDKL